jgi:hypothetical protein
MDKFVLIIENTLNNSVFLCESKIIPRIDDRIPIKGYKDARVGCVTLYLNVPDNLKLKKVNPAMAQVIEESGYLKEDIDALIHIE